MLTMVTLNTGFRSALPPVSYIKAIDIWMATCLIFVFCALLEFAIVNSIHRQSAKQLNKSIARTYDSLEENPRTVAIKMKLDHMKKARSVDKLSRILFPALFLLFNAIYWIVTLK